MQPQGNVTVAEGDDAYFPCTYDGIHTSPYWNISSADGRQKIVSTNNLPYKHYFNGTGLIVQNVDARNNMTLYSCILQVAEGDDDTTQTSTSGQLIVKENIHFSLQLINNDSDIDNTTSSRQVIVHNRESLTVTIAKHGYTRNTYLVFLKIVTRSSTAPVKKCGKGYQNLLN